MAYSQIVGRDVIDSAQCGFPMPIAQTMWAYFCMALNVASYIAIGTSLERKTTAPSIWRSTSSLLGCAGSGISPRIRRKFVQPRAALEFH